jgi:SprT protein
MPITEHPLQALENYLPNNSFKEVLAYIQHYNIHVLVTKQRKTVLGDYRHKAGWGNHKISINGNLNKYEFLITFLHELAHLLTWEQFKNTVEPHGKEWKYYYSQLLQHFMQLQIFPNDIVAALQKSILNPAATANGEAALLKVLRTYSTIKKAGYITVEDVEDGQFFITEKGKVFQRIGKRRKRIECIAIDTKLRYSFSTLAEVKLVQDSKKFMQ